MLFEEKEMKRNVYLELIKIGEYSGCHQMPDRSFNIKGYQFPVCARCTGVLIGNIASYAMFFIYAPPFQFCLMGCAVMYADWLIQHLDIRESTNIRRLITGTIGGYALTTLYCIAIKVVIRFITDNLY